MGVWVIFYLGNFYSVLFNNAGEPDFAAYSRGEVDIPVNVSERRNNKNKNEDKRFRRQDYKAATKVLWEKMESGKIDRSSFQQDQLEVIQRIVEGDTWFKIPTLTWHHDGHSLNSDGSGKMSLVETDAHQLFNHKGWHSTLKNGEI